MKSIYSCYKCIACGKEIILLTEEVGNMSKGRYIACPYCNSKRISKAKATDDLRECMKERVYKRENGALRQVK